MPLHARHALASAATTGLPSHFDLGTSCAPRLGGRSYDAIASCLYLDASCAMLGLAVSDPPTQSEAQQLADKLDELITALRQP